MNSLAEPSMDEAELDHQIGASDVMSTHAETLRHLRDELSESAVQLESATTAAVQAIAGQTALREELSGLKISSQSEILELRSFLAAATDRAAKAEAQLSERTALADEALGQEKALSASLDLRAQTALAQLEALELRLSQADTRLEQEATARELLELKLREMIAVSQGEIAKIVSHTERFQGLRFAYLEVDALNQRLADMAASRDASLELLDAERRTTADLRRALVETQAHREIVEHKIVGLLATMRGEAQKIVDHTERRHSAMVALSESENRLSLADLRIAALSAELEAARESAASAEREVEARFTALEARHGEAQQQLLAEIQGSTSWRITSPMRAVVGFIRRA